MRKAFQEAVSDPAFIAQAKKERVEIHPVTAEHVHQVLDRAYAMPADVVKIASEALNITGASDAN
jgi:hypothetical protein